MNHLKRERKPSRRRLDKLDTLDGIGEPQTEKGNQLGHPKKIRRRVNLSEKKRLYNKDDGAENICVPTYGLI